MLPTIETQLTFGYEADEMLGTPDEFVIGKVLEALFATSQDECD